MNEAKAAGKASLGGKKHHGVVGGAITAFLVTLAISTLTILISAVILFFAPRGAAYISVTGMVISLFSALLGGIVAGRRSRHAGMIAGLLFGILYLCVMLLLGQFFYTNAPRLKRLLGFILFPALALVGGGLGGMRTVSHKHRKHRRR